LILPAENNQNKFRHAAAFSIDHEITHGRVWKTVEKLSLGFGMAAVEGCI
jgi:hypothetical protein